MNKSKLHKAMFEARRFYDKAKELDKERSDDGTDFNYKGSALTGSVKRASMDLTRALADLRKPL